VTGGPAPRRLRILDEETVRRAPPPGADPDAINPYWLDEEPPEHPDPEAGCIRRGYCCRAHPGWFAPGEVELEGGQAAVLREGEGDPEEFPEIPQFLSDDPFLRAIEPRFRQVFELLGDPRLPQGEFECRV